MTTILTFLLATVGLFVIAAAAGAIVRSIPLLKKPAVARTAEITPHRARAAAAMVVVLLLAGTAATAQPVVPVDVDKLLATLPAPAMTPVEALRRTGTNGAKTYYQPWRDQLGKIAGQLVQQQTEFYQQYPTGVRPTAPPPNRVSATQQASMDGAMAEFAAKLQSDPAFAQEFMKKSETEQQAYIASLLANNGIKPATPPAGATMTAQPDQEPINWIDLTSTLTQDWAAYLPAHAMSNLLYKAGQQHDDVAKRWNAALEKVPMVELGEYGHDRDPKQVEALRVKFMAEHRAVAARTLEEGRAVLRENQAAFQRITAPYLTAMRGVNHGKDYDFTIFYANILGQQQWLLQMLDQLVQEAVELTEHVAQWEGAK